MRPSQDYRATDPRATQERPKTDPQKRATDRLKQAKNDAEKTREKTRKRARKKPRDPAKMTKNNNLVTIVKRPKNTKHNRTGA